MPKKNKAVLRNFYYYDISLMKQEDGNFTRIANQEESFYKIFSFINQKQGEIEKKEGESDEISIATMRGDKMYILVDKVERGFPIEFRMILCRTDAFPFIEHNGLLDFLTSYIPDGVSLAEITHCVLFPKYNIMGAEHNFSGAKATALKHYIPAIFPEIEYVHCVNRLNEKIIDRLRKNDKFSLFSIAVLNGSDAMTYMINKHSIFHELFASTSNIDVFEITLKRTRKKTKGGFDSPIPIERMDEFMRDYRDDIKKFRVSQGSIQGDAINLLHDKLVETREVTKTINKTIDSNEAYKIIKDFFNETVRATLNQRE